MGGIAAGTLNQRVTLQRKTVTQDSWGGAVESWSDVATVWANVRGFTGIGAISNEVQAGGSEVSRGKASIRIRIRSDVTHDMRVQYRGKVYDIRDVCPNEEDRRYMDLVVAVGASNG
jgi:SPP1 family predicted phage head-tail adaptor